MVTVPPIKGNQKTAVRNRVDARHFLVAQLAPEGFRFRRAEILADRRVLLIAFCPSCLELPRSWCGNGGRESREIFSIAGNDDFLSALDPFGHIGKMISQISHGRCFHCETQCITHWKCQTFREWQLLFCGSATKTLA